MEFLEVTAQIVAAGASVAALLIAHQANRLAKQTASETTQHVAESNRLALSASQQNEDHARKAEERELMRDQREIASNMQAWWVVKEEQHQKRWGLLVSTLGATNSVFYDVQITVLNNRRLQKTRPITTLPPGLYFLQSVRTPSGEARFESPEYIDSMADYQPLVHAESHNVESIDFKDQLGKQWTWSRKTGLTESTR